MRLSALFYACAIALLSPSVSVAGVFKCLDSDGSVTYSQSACEPEQETSKILEISSESGPKQDCRAPARFASQVAKGMKAGTSSGDVFSQYGGIDSLNPSTVALINYVYSHKGNDAASASRITALTKARCEVKSFGISDCDTLPYEFIESVGGCDAAMHGGGMPSAENSSRLPQGQPVGQQVEKSAYESNDDDGPMGYQPELASDDCKTRLTAEIKEVYKAMRESRSAADQSALNDRRNELRRELGYCR